MRIKEIMNAPAIACRSDDMLTKPAQLMWEHDCGAMPVVGEEGQVIGMVTDRDICMAAYLQNRTLDSIRVSEIMARQVLTCRTEDPVDAAERVMRENQVRRIPVLDPENRLAGILSMNDIARKATDSRKNGAEREFIRTMSAICQPRNIEAGAKPQA